MIQTLPSFTSYCTASRRRHSSGWPSSNTWSASRKPRSRIQRKSPVICSPSQRKQIRLVSIFSCFKLWSSLSSIMVMISSRNVFTHLYCNNHCKFDKLNVNLRSLDHTYLGDSPLSGHHIAKFQGSGWLRPCLS